MVHTGSVYVGNGTTMIILKGKTKSAMFNYYYLMQKGPTLGYTIIMTENAFTTYDA